MLSLAFKHKLILQGNNQTVDIQVVGEASKAIIMKGPPQGINGE